MIEAVIFDLGNVLAFHDNAVLFSRMATLFDGCRAMFAMATLPDFRPNSTLLC